MAKVYKEITKDISKSLAKLRMEAPELMKGFGDMATAGFSMFPFVMPSATDPVSSLTMWDAVSSKKTMGIMLVVTLIFLPLILFYTSWVFSVLRGKVTLQAIQDHSNSMY